MTVMCATAVSRLW